MSLLAVVLIAAMPCEDITLQGSAGVEWSSGTYGFPESTTARIAPISLTANSGAWQVSLSGAYAEIDGPADVALLETPPPTGERPSSVPLRSRRREGLTDLTLDAAWTTGRDMSSLWYGFGGGLTLPTGSVAKGLGVGASDIFVHADAGIDLDPVFLSGGAQYRLIKDAMWRDPLSVWLSASRRFGRASLAGAGFSASQGLTSASDGQATVSLFFQRDIGGQVQFDANVWKGLNAVSGDFGVSFSFRRPLGVMRR
jgi:hypothetical protein